MFRSAAMALGLIVLPTLLLAQTPPETGDRSTPLNPLGGEGNVGISNAVLRGQPEVRVLRVVVEPGGQRAMHEHANVDFHLFIPISGVMRLELEEGGSVEVQPMHPYFMDGGTQHGFHNDGDTPVEIMEVFVP